MPQSWLADLHQAQAVQELFDSSVIYQLFEVEVLLSALDLCNKVQAKVDYYKEKIVETKSSSSFKKS